MVLSLSRTGLWNAGRVCDDIVFVNSLAQRKTLDSMITELFGEAAACSRHQWILAMWLGERSDMFVEAALCSRHVCVAFGNSSRLGERLIFILSLEVKAY